MGQVTIALENGILFCSDGKALLPLDDESLIMIVGGNFDGEIMEYNKETKSITWQNIVFERE
jgi:hypothetical protein